MSRSRKTRSFGRELVVNLCLLFGTLVFFFLILEVGLRLFNPLSLEYYRFDPDLAYTAIPDVSLYETAPSLPFYHEFAGWKQTNSQGYFDTEHSFERDSRVRVLMLGDSFTGGVGVPQDARFSSLLASRMNDAEFVNLGLSSYNFETYFLQLKRDGMRYHPQIVVVNAFMGNDLEDKGLLAVNNYTLVAHQKQPYPFSQSIRRWMARHMHTYILLQKLIVTNAYLQPWLIAHGFNVPRDRVQDIFSLGVRDDYAHRLHKVDLILRDFASFAQSQNITLVLHMIPVREQVDDELYESYYSSRGMQPFVGQFELQNDLLRIAAHYNITVVDPLSRLRHDNVNNTFYHSHDGHWNARGHEIAAQELEKTLRTVEKQQTTIFINNSA